MKDLSNWGRWGAKTRWVRVNLITPAKRKAAAALVKEGVAVSWPTMPTRRKRRTTVRLRPPDASTGASPNGQYVMDEYSVSYHGLAHTHMDALSHMAYQGKMYNGSAADRGDGDKGDRTGRDRVQRRHLHARHPDGHSPSEEFAISGTRSGDLPGRPGSVGEKGRRQDRRGGRRLHPHRPVGARAKRRGLGSGPGRGTVCFLRKMAEGSRCRDGGQRLPTRT